MKTFISAILLLLFTNTFAFSNYHYDDDTLATNKDKNFTIGFFIGSFFANKYTVNIYDGYGFDDYGNKNIFQQSYLYKRIVVENTMPGQVDKVAQALGISPGQWSFTEYDMPVNMRYMPAFMFGFSGRYSVNEFNAILFNANVTQINAVGNFTITDNTVTNSNNYYNKIRTCNIKGVEKRLMMQIGYQHLLGEEESKTRFIIEGGLHANITRYDKNEVLIGSLRIDLLSPYYSPVANDAYIVIRPIKFGVGVFAGAGVSYRFNKNWLAQLIYNPSYESIRIVPEPKLKLQHAVGLRFYKYL